MEGTSMPHYPVGNGNTEHVDSFFSAGIPFADAPGAHLSQGDRANTTR